MKNNLFNQMVELFMDKPEAGGSGMNEAAAHATAENALKKMHSGKALNRASTFANVRLANAKADDPRAGQFLAAARLQLSTAQQAALLPVAKRLNQLYHAAAGQTPEELQAALLNFRDVEVPALLKTVAADPATAAAMESIIGTALVDGFAVGPVTSPGGESKP